MVVEAGPQVEDDVFADAARLEEEGPEGDGLDHGHRSEGGDDGEQRPGITAAPGPQRRDAAVDAEADQQRPGQ